MQRRHGLGLILAFGGLLIGGCSDGPADAPKDSGTDASPGDPECAERLAAWDALRDGAAVPSDALPYPAEAIPGGAQWELLEAPAGMRVDESGLVTWVPRRDQSGRSRVRGKRGLLRRDDVHRGAMSVPPRRGKLRTQPRMLRPNALWNRNGPL